MSEEISKEVRDYVDNLQSQLDFERSSKTKLQSEISQSSLGANGRDQTIVELQLELDETLNQIYHQLSGHELTFNSELNKYEWSEPKDDRLKNFSNYGVKIIMNKLKMYLNINTLMGFYDENTIRWKVKDFGVELSDLFLTRYEHLLHYPTPEELFDKYKPIVKKRNQTLQNDKKITEEELYQKCIRWSEDELAARENILPGICWDLINMVHSTYTRAFLGKERTSLGERGININQSTNPDSPIQIPTKGGMFSR